MPLRPPQTRCERIQPAALLIACLLAAALCPLARAAGQPDPNAPRPNIVLIMADDMGFADIGCYGGEVRTPHLDRLAAQGLRFTQFYNNAKCTTTRASLLTGLYPRQGGRGIHLLDQRMTTLAEALAEAGYHTALSGKWHLGADAPHRPIDRGFHAFYGLMDGCCNYFNPARRDPPFKRGVTGDGYRTFGRDDRLITEFPDDFYTTDAFTDHAVRSIHRFAADDRPFFLHIAYTAPHYPLHARPRDIARYERQYLIGWDKLRRRRHARQVEMGLIDPGWNLPGRDPEVHPWAEEPNKPWQARRMAVYAAMIDAMDRGIGRILEALDEAGQTQNTIVLFLSDNGGCAEQYAQDRPDITPGPEDTYTTCGPQWAWAQNTPFRRYKTFMHEGGIATPLIVRYPGIVEPATVTDQVGHIIDFMPTFLDLAGAEYPSSHEDRELLPLEGRSLLPVFRGRGRGRGGARRPHEALYWHWAGNRAVRSGRWKLVWDKGVGQWELYDMTADRTETRNLAAQHPDRVASLAAGWRDWAERTGVE